MTFSRVHSGIIPGPRTEAPPSPQRGSRLTERLPPLKWWERGACIGLDGELRGGKGSVWIEPSLHPSKIVDRALEVCKGCPVREQCRREDTGHGIWGGVAHVINSHTKRVRTCHVCGAEYVAKYRQECSRECYDRSKYRSTIESQSMPSEPFFDFIGATGVPTISDKIGISRRLVYRWRGGERIAPSSVVRICKALGVEADEIWAPTSSVTKPNEHLSGANVGLNSEGRNRVNGYGLLAEQPDVEAPRMKKSVRATSAPREVRER